MSSALVLRLRELSQALSTCNLRSRPDCSNVAARLMELQAGLEAERCALPAAVAGAALALADEVLRSGVASAEAIHQVIARLLLALDSAEESHPAQAPGQHPGQGAWPPGAHPGYWMPPGYGYPMPMAGMPPMGYGVPGGMPAPMPHGYGGYPGHYPAAEQPQAPLPQPPVPQSPPSGTILKGGAAAYMRVGQQGATSTPAYGPVDASKQGGADASGLQLVNHRKLGEILVSMAMITPEDLERALKAQKSTGKRLGEVLVSMGLLTKEMVESAVRLQKQRFGGQPPGAPGGDPQRRR
jgi:hypothetical protein